MVPPQRSDLQHIFELWEPVKDFGQVALLKAVELGLVALLALVWNHSVLVDDLEDE